MNVGLMIFLTIVIYAPLVIFGSLTMFMFVYKVYKYIWLREPVSFSDINHPFSHMDCVEKEKTIVWMIVMTIYGLVGYAVFWFWMEPDHMLGLKIMLYIALSLLNPLCVMVFFSSIYNIDYR